LGSKRRLAFSRWPTDILSIPPTNLSGNGGEKAVIFLFNQPNGVVITTSSKHTSSPFSVLITTVPPSVSRKEVEIPITLVFRRIAALSNGVLAASARIDEKLEATKSSSVCFISLYFQTPYSRSSLLSNDLMNRKEYKPPPQTSSSHTNLKLCFFTSVPI
jgi:hypothetical protein